MTIDTRDIHDRSPAAELPSRLPPVARQINRKVDAKSERVKVDEATPFLSGYCPSKKPYSAHSVSSAKHS